MHALCRNGKEYTYFERTFIQKRHVIDFALFSLVVLVTKAKMEFNCIKCELDPRIPDELPIFVIFTCTC